MILINNFKFKWLKKKNFTLQSKYIVISSRFLLIKNLKNEKNIYNKIINWNWSFSTLLEFLSNDVNVNVLSSDTLIILHTIIRQQKMNSRNRYIGESFFNSSLPKKKKKKKKKWNEFNSAEVGLCSLPFGSRINPSKQSRYNSHPPFATPSVHLLKFRNWLRTIFKYASERKFNLFLLVILNKIYSKFHLLDFIFFSIMQIA